jgi:hypothetical protein
MHQQPVAVRDNELWARLPGALLDPNVNVTPNVVKGDPVAILQIKPQTGGARTADSLLPVEANEQLRMRNRIGPSLRDRVRALPTAQLSLHVL